MANRFALLTAPAFLRNKQREGYETSLFTGGNFVGREQEIAALRAHLEDTFAGCGRLVLLVGEAGIGKTRTAQEVAAQARKRGAQVLVGRCYEGDGAPPYWPWVQIVRTYLRDCTLEMLQSHMGPGAVDIAQVIPEVRERLPQLLLSPTLNPEHGRFRFFDSFTTFLKNVAHARPLMLIIDDLHWADASSLLLLQFLVQELSTTPILIVATYRDLALELHHPLRQTLGELARGQGSQTIPLRGLTESEVAAFMQNAIGSMPDARLLAAVHQQTEGNPFFLIEVVRLLANGEQQYFSLSQSVHPLPIPQRVYDVISRRLTPLSAEGLQVLMLAAVIGRGFTLDVLTQASSLPRAHILQALEEALMSRIITMDDQQTINSYSFSHALIREALYKELTLTQRMTSHRRVGEALEMLYRTASAPHLTALAHHFSVAAQSGGDVEKAIHYATQAGEQASAVFAYEEAAQYYHDALRLRSLHKPQDETHSSLLLALGDAQRRAGQRTQTRETFLAAANLARQLHHSQHLARAALGFAGLWVAIGVVDKAAVTLLEEALAALGEEDDVLRARLYARLATEFWFAQSSEQRVKFSQQAVQLARRTADQKTLGYCLQAYHALALWGSPRLTERLAVTAEILQLAEQTGDLELALHGYIRRVTDLVEIGDPFALDAAIAAHARVAEVFRQPQYLWYAVIWKGMRALMTGEFAKAEQLAQQALSVGQQTQVSHEDAVLGFGIQLFNIRREQGRLSEIAPMLKGFLEQYSTIAAFRCSLAYLYSEVGQEAEAREQFEELARRGFTDLPQDMNFPLSLALLASTCAFLHDTHRATQLYPLLLPYADYNIQTSMAIAYHGPAAYSLGLLATVLEQWDDAQTYFTAAITMNTRLGARPRLANAQYAYACMLLTRQHAGDPEQALVHLDSAFTIAQELGMTGLMEKVQSLKFDVQSKASLESSVQGLESKEPVVDHRLSLQPPTCSFSQHSVFRREGDYWTITYRETSFRLRHIRGLNYIAQLLQHPNIEFHVLDLVSLTQRPASASSPSTQTVTFSEFPTQSQPQGGDTLVDAKARQAYKQRLTELREELEEANAFNDLGRADKAQQEIDVISAELARGFGLGGRPRKTPSPAERARVNVVKGVKAALVKIAEHNPLLEHYLATTIKTGVFCSYIPHPLDPISWEF